MSEKPILFSAPMVRAILDGRKTQTRRVLKDPGALNWDGGDVSPALLARCPYGAPGDRLWVRETFGTLGRMPSDGPPPRGEEKTTCYRATDDVVPHIIKWRPSIHMPRWASRITLEITGVRVERLEVISEDDAREEGAECDLAIGSNQPERRLGFKRLWDSINGDRANWKSNPRVWVVSFRRVQP